jgi:hypothetical protein
MILGGNKVSGGHTKNTSADRCGAPRISNLKWDFCASRNDQSVSNGLEGMDGVLEIDSTPSIWF